MEVSALKAPATPGLRTPSTLLRLQSDERLIALIRRGQHSAFEALFSRYQSRLLAFCRHMLGSKEDAEDVLQEVFAAAFNAILADEREINVRPWLYRIARNRSLNHLRKASAIGVDSMDVHYAENGLSTAEKAMRRESFRQLIGDVQQLAETQRTALLLREIDALSYEQIAEAMETTVPAVKSLLVRARISLAEAAEARKLSCEEARMELGEVAEGLVKLTPAVRRHVRDCERCRAFRKHLKENNVALAAIMPVPTLLLIKKLVLSKLGGTASAGGAHVAGAGAGAGGATAAAAGVTAAGGASAGTGLLTAGAGALATKAVAGLAVAAIVTAGTVAAERSTSAAHRHRRPAVAATSAADAPAVAEPVATRSLAQPTSYAAASPPREFARTGRVRRAAAPTAKKAKLLTVATSPATATDPTTAAATTPGGGTATPAATPPKQTTPSTAPATEVTTDSTQLPDRQPQTGAPASSSEAAGSAPAAGTQTTTTTVETGAPSSTGTTTTPPPPPPPASAPTGQAGEAVTPAETSPHPSGPSAPSAGEVRENGGTAAP